MKRLVYLATVALLALLILAPAAVAQQDGNMMMDGDMMMNEGQMMGQGQMMSGGGQGQMMSGGGQGQMQQSLPRSGGPSLVGLSAIALLVGSGLVGAYAIRRRTRRS